MKKHGTSRPYVSLGELVEMISTCAARESEVVVGIRDLFRRGRMVARTRRGIKPGLLGAEALGQPRAGY